MSEYLHVRHERKSPFYIATFPNTRAGREEARKVRELFKALGNRIQTSGVRGGGTFDMYSYPKKPRKFKRHPKKILVKFYLTQPVPRDTEPPHKVIR